MPKKSNPTSERLQFEAEPDIKFCVALEGMGMFEFTGKANKAPSFQWNDDRSRCEMSFDLEEYNLRVVPDKDGRPVAKIDLSRRVALAAWVGMDPALVQDLNEMQRTGEPSELLQEVRRALGIPDEEEH